MEAQHSPTPWRLDIPAANAGKTTLRAADGRPIAEILHPGLRYEDSMKGPRYAHESQANGALIVGAPELAAKYERLIADLSTILHRLIDAAENEGHLGYCVEIARSGLARLDS